MFCLNSDFPLGKSVVWHKHAEIVDTQLLFEYLQSLDYQKGDCKEEIFVENNDGILLMVRILI